MFSGMAMHAPEEPESIWPDWNVPASFPEGSIGRAMQSLYSGMDCFVKSLLPSFIHDPIQGFKQRVEEIMARIDPSLKDNQLKMGCTILKFGFYDFVLFNSFHQTSQILPEEILTILEQQPEEIFGRISILETAIDQKPDLVRLLRSVIGLNRVNRYGVESLIEHLKKNKDMYPELNIDPEHFNQIYHQMCVQKYKYTINLLLALDKEKPGRLGQLADDLGRISQDTMHRLNGHNWTYKMQDPSLIDFARLILNWNQILYDLAPSPSISKISVSHSLSGETFLERNISSEQGFEFFQKLYEIGFVRFDGGEVRIVGGAVPYYVKQGLLNSFSVLDDVNICSFLVSILNKYYFVLYLFNL